MLKVETTLKTQPLKTFKMKQLLIVILNFIYISFTYGQDAPNLKSHFTSLVGEIEYKIFIQSECDYLIDQLEDIKSEVERLLSNSNDLRKDEVTTLQWLKNHCQATKGFLQTVGTSARISWQINEKDMSLVKEILPINISENINYSLCCKIFDVRFGNYICVLEFKSGTKEIFGVKARISSDNGKKMLTTDHGLEANFYGKLWSNENKLSITSYKITSMNCIIRGYNNF